MRRPNRWWVVCTLAVLLAVPACTENDLDEGDQDVVLEITSFNTPPVTGEIELGFCQLSPAIPCLNNNNCPIGDVCDLSVISGECNIPAWSFGLANLPLSEGASESPFNDVILNNLVIFYDWPDPIVDFSRTIGLFGVVIPAGGNGTIQFPPISTADLIDDDTAVSLTLTIDARTVAGIDVNMPPAQGTLFIADCIP